MGMIVNTTLLNGFLKINKCAVFQLYTRKCIPLIK